MAAYPNVQLKRLNNYVNRYSLLPIDSVDYLNRHIKKRLHIPIFNKIRDCDDITLDAIKAIFRRIVGRNSDLYKNAIQVADERMQSNDTKLFLSYVATRRCLASVGLEQKLSKPILVYMTYVIEYIVAEIFQVAEFYIQPTERTRIVTIESIRQAISKDDELRRVFKIYK